MLGTHCHLAIHRADALGAQGAYSHRDSLLLAWRIDCSMLFRRWQGPGVLLQASSTGPPLAPHLSSYLLQDLLHTSNTAYTGVGKLF